MTAFSRLCLGKNIQLNLDIHSISKSYNPRPVYLRILLKTVLCLAQRPQLYLLSSLLRLCHIQPNLQTCKTAFPTYTSSAPLFRLPNLLHQKLTSYNACLLQEEEVLVYYYYFILLALPLQSKPLSSACPARTKDNLLLSFFHIQVLVSHRTHTRTQSCEAMNVHSAYIEKISLQSTGDAQFLKPAGDTRSPTLTSVLWHIRLLQITIPVRPGLGQPADFARSGQPLLSHRK